MGMKPLLLKCKSSQGKKKDKEAIFPEAYFLARHDFQL